MPSLEGIRITLVIAAACALVALVATLAIPALPAPVREEQEIGVTDVGHTGAWVHGRVVLAGGDPASGGRVTVVGLDGRQLGVAPVAPDGGFTLAALDAPDPTGEHRTVLLIAGHPRGAPRAVHVQAGPHSAPRRLVLDDPQPGSVSPPMGARTSPL